MSKFNDKKAKLGLYGEKKLVVGLEVGTAKVSAVVGEILPDGMVNIIGVGRSPSRGVDRGGVNDFEAVVSSVRRAVEDAELMADCAITSVYLALSGRHIDCQNEIGMVPIANDEVTEEDVHNVVHTAKSVRVSEENRILHVIPQDFKIDHQDGIKNPIGLSGVRMHAKVHLITCHNDMAKNITKAVEKCDLNVDQLIFSGLASSYSVLTEDEKDLGVCLIDIGAGTMDISIYTGGFLRHSAVIPYAGNQVTYDIAYALSTPLNDAEDIKIKYGCALASAIARDDMIEVPSVGGRPARSLQREILAGVIEARYTELLTFANNEVLKVQNYMKSKGIKNQLAAGFVLTGGASQIEGLVECAEAVFHNQVRIGYPHNITGLTDYASTPEFSTPLGLIFYGKGVFTEDISQKTSNVRIKSVFSKMKNWLKKEF
ncbi:cell division protein FtsA [Thorsellia kenyensis]|uniref:Cell division protein FtsA n=1 Tax=Thorsellia kenyensis TaxID=1549888 RepID=A0ABV6CBM3_9GAMM